MPRALFGCLLLILLLATHAGFSPVAAQSPHHYLCRVLVSEEGLTLLSARRIDAPIPQRRTHAEAGPLLATLHSPDGQLLHESRHSDPRLLRAPLAPEGAQVHASHTRPEGVLLLRLPAAPPGARLRLLAFAAALKRDATPEAGTLLGELTLDLASQAGVEHD